MAEYEGHILAQKARFTINIVNLFVHAYEHVTVTTFCYQFSFCFN